MNQNSEEEERESKKKSLKCLFLLFMFYSVLLGSSGVAQKVTLHALHCMTQI